MGVWVLIDFIMIVFGKFKDKQGLKLTNKNEYQLDELRKMRKIPGKCQLCGKKFGFMRKKVEHKILSSISLCEDCLATTILGKMADPFKQTKKIIIKCPECEEGARLTYNTLTEKLNAHCSYCKKDVFVYQSEEGKELVSGLKSVGQGFGTIAKGVGKAALVTGAVVVGSAATVAGAAGGSLIKGRLGSSSESRSKNKKTVTSKQDKKKNTRRWSSSKAVCATCDAWAGERKPQNPPPLRSQNVIEISERGYCAIKRVQRSYMGSCENYKKWGILR